MKIRIFFLVLLSIYGCSVFNFKSEHCNKHRNFIKSQWKQVNDTLYQMDGNPDLSDTVVFNKYLPKHCLFGKDEKYITQLFGKPSFIYKDDMNPNLGRWVGYLYENKDDPEYYIKRKIAFYFDEDDFLKKIDGHPMSRDGWNIYN